MIIRPRYPRVVSAKRQLPPGIVTVPVQFRLKHPFKYPPSNHLEFERWYFETYSPAMEADRLYLPIHWTSYYCANKFGADPRSIKHLQSFINSLDRSKKYYTICQYDDGPDNKDRINFKELDIKVFGMAGGRNDYPIPLVCQPQPIKKVQNRDLYASFVGKITHEIRGKMIKALEGIEGCFISTKDQKMDEYCTTMARSVFALCPRGYSATSFRISEAIEHGAIPVYISDKHLLPYNLPFDYGLIIGPNDDIKQALSDVPKPMITVLRQNLERIKPYFTYQGCKQKILEELRNEKI
jgi:hypothetical protein